MSWLYYTEKLAAKMLLFLFTRLKVQGKENVPDQGALLVVANHLGMADPVILGVELGRRVEFMAKEELFRSKLIAFFVRGFGSFPSYKGRLDMAAMRQSSRVLAQGGALAMFPEGKRSKDASLEIAYHGSALIALRNDVPILPVGITGTEEIKGIGWILRRPRVTVTVGKPFRLPAFNGRLTRAELAKCTEIIMNRVAELIPEEYCGEYGERGD